MQRKKNFVLDKLFRGMSAVNGLWCIGMVGKLELDPTYPLVRGMALAFGFLGLSVLCAWLGNWLTEWLGVRPFGGEVR